MAVKNGRYAKVTVDDVLVAEMGQYTLTGFNRDVLEHTAFGSVMKTFIAGHVDGGEITMSGYYDASSASQRVLESAAESGRIFTPGQIKVYIDANYYFTTDTDGTMFVTRAKSVGMDKYGIGTTEFTIKVCGTALVLLPPRSASVSASPSASPSSSPSKSPSSSPSASASPSASPSGT